jgi:hypothetical protein
MRALPRRLPAILSLRRRFRQRPLPTPVFVGLSRFGGSRGRVALADQDFAIVEYTVGEDLRPPPRNAIALAISRQGNFSLARDFRELGPGDRVLLIVPLAPFREGQDTLAAAAERFLHGG